MIKISGRSIAPSPSIQPNMGKRPKHKKGAPLAWLASHTIRSCFTSPEAHKGGEAKDAIDAGLQPSFRLRICRIPAAKLSGKGCGAAVAAAAATVQ